MSMHVRSNLYLGIEVDGSLFLSRRKCDSLTNPPFGPTTDTELKKLVGWSEKDAPETLNELEDDLPVVGKDFTLFRVHPTAPLMLGLQLVKDLECQGEQGSFRILSLDELQAKQEAVLSLSLRFGLKKPVQMVLSTRWLANQVLKTPREGLFHDQLGLTKFYTRYGVHNPSTWLDTG